MRQHVPPQHLWTEFQGDMEFDYDHAIYWPALLKLCEEKQSEQKERWVKGGKIYGESELYLKGGDAASLGQLSVESQVSEKGKESIPVESKQEIAAAKE